jgi:hypothetical protein
MLRSYQQTHSIRVAQEHRKSRVIGLFAIDIIIFYEK